MVDWMCSVPLCELTRGLQKVEAGRSTDPRSALNGSHFHVLHGTAGSTVHLIGSDGPERGAICHVEAVKLGTDSSFRCLLPGNLQSRIEAEFEPDEVLRLGTRKAGAEFVVAGVVDSRRLVFPVRPGWGAQGIACFADASFTVVEPDVYWVKGGVEPLLQPGVSSAPSQVQGAFQASDVFVEDDVDGYDEEPVETTAAAPAAVPAPGPAAPQILRPPRPPGLIPLVPAAAAMPTAAPAAPPLRTQISPSRQSATASTMERVAKPSARGERTR